MSASERAEITQTRNAIGNPIVSALERNICNGGRVCEFTLSIVDQARKAIESRRVKDA